MSTEKITEKLTKVVIGMIENDNCGVLSLDTLLQSVPELQTNDAEQLYLSCKTASEIVTKLSKHFTRPAIISFKQGEMMLNNNYVPDCKFTIVWAP